MTVMRDEGAGTSVCMVLKITAMQSVGSSNPKFHPANPLILGYCLPLTDCPES